MRNKFLSLCVLFAMIMAASVVSAAQLKAYVEEFAVTGAPNRDELKVTLQTMLASRLSSQDILTVDSASSADVLVKGSYIVFGKVYSIDAVARDRGGKVLSRSFQQGESQDELIPALGKLAASLGSDIAKAAVPVSAVGGGAAVVAVPAPVPVDVVKKPLPSAAGADIIKPEPVEKSAGNAWISQRLAGEMSSMAPGRMLEGGVRELVVANDNSLRLYHAGKELKLVADASYPATDKILSLDTADLDKNGVLEIYVTLMSGGTLSSQIWEIRGNSMVRVAEKLPYYFRALALDGKEQRVYAQQTSLDAPFYGDVYEVVKKGESIDIKNPIKLPRFGFLYNFNRFTDAGGKSFFVVINDDGYLIVYSASGEELWRSSDKFGGSEQYFKQEDQSSFRVTGDQYRWNFLEQRIVVNREGDVIVPQNGGFFVFGHNRSYKKNSIFAFRWNGSFLDEVWHTRLSQNYLADYFLDEANKELVLLEVSRKEGMFDKGASVVVVKKVE